MNKMQILKFENVYKYKNVENRFANKRNNNNAQLKWLSLCKDAFLNTDKNINY